MTTFYHFSPHSGVKPAISPNLSVTFAPAIFSKDADARGMTKDSLRAAIDRLLKDGKIKIETFGPRSHERKRLTLSHEGNNA